ncbi:MAG: ABC transporter permease subunit [Streptosporangiaceae bacterium]
MSAVTTTPRSERSTPYRSSRRQGSDGFASLVRSEWTKFRTVPAWALAIVVATAAALGLSVFLSTSAGQSCPGGAGASCNGQAPPTGPGGEPVTDSYYLVHQSMGEIGSITARVTSLANVPSGTGGIPGGIGPTVGTIEPWAKAGIIVTASTAQGSSYAAVMVTADYGVRLQYDYTHDIAGPAASVTATSPEWLRLTRSGDTVTAYASSDDVHWTTIGTVTLRGLPHTVQIGMFAASPDSAVLHQANVITGAKGTFDHVALRGGLAGAQWRGTQVGPGRSSGQRGYIEPGQQPHYGGFSEAAGTFGVTGSGDIGPYLPPEDALGNSLVGLIVALIVVIAVTTLFVTAEYRRGLIRTTLSASPRRGRVLAAKVIVSAVVAFVLGLVAAAIALPVAEHLLRAHGYAPPWWLTGTGLFSGTGLRIVFGTGALFALAAALAVGVGTITRRSAAAVSTAIVVIVLPVVLMFTLPESAALWVQKYTPAAAFSLQSSIPHYQQMACYPTKGCFALSPWAGFGVLAAYTAIALIGAFVLLRTRDA